MVQRISPSTVIVSSNNGESHLKITLELNINLNSNAPEIVQASIVPVAKKEEPIEDDFAGFEVPSFDSSKKISFGNKV